MQTIRLLGGAVLEDPDGSVVRPPVRRLRMAVLVALVLSRTRAATRDRLLALLWPETDTDRARHQLRECVYRLRESLTDGALVSVGDELRLDPAHVRCDVWQMEAAVEQREWLRADALFTGPLLDGCHLANTREFEQWVDAERSRLAAMHGNVLEALAAECRDRGDAGAAVAVWQRRVAMDPLDARGVRQLMEALEHAGDRTGALRQATIHATRLKDELDAAPDHAVSAYAEALRRRSAVLPRREDTAPPVVSVDRSTVPAGPAHAIASGPARATALVEPAPPAALVRRARWSFFAAPMLVALAMVLAARGRVRPELDARTTTKLTMSPGVELDPAFSPDGQFLAYAAGPPGHTRIHVRRLAGGGDVQVSGSDMRADRWPTWSPDGTQIAYLATNGDRGEMSSIMIVQALGGTPRVLANTRSFHATPAWSPSGQSIAYPADDSIVITPVSDGATRRIPAVAPAHSLVWSPDGRRIAFVAGNPLGAFGTTSFGNRSPSRIFTASVDGGPAVPVAQGQHMFLSPAWLPDSRSLLYVSNVDGAFDIYRVALGVDGSATTSPRRLTTGLGAQGIRVAPDGSRLAYSVLGVRSNIFSAPVVSGRATPSAAITSVTSGTQTIETADVTRDGAWLAFDSDRDGHSRIYRMRVSGGEPVLLTRDTTDAFAPRWSPDGRWIAFHSRRGRPTNRDVFVMDADGDRVVQISADPADESYPFWSLDGQSVYFARNGFGIMVARRDTGGRWSEPVAAPVPERGQPTADGRYRIRHQADGLYRYGPDGARRRLVGDADVRGHVTTMALGPDPRVLYVRAYDSAGVHAFYRMPVAGGKPSLVLRLDGTSRQPARIIFSTDGRRLFFTLTEAESDVWLMTLRSPAR